MDNRGYQQSDPSEYSIPRVSMKKNEALSPASDYAFNTPNYSRINNANGAPPLRALKADLAGDGFPAPDQDKPRRPSASSALSNYEDKFEDLEWEPNSPVARFINGVQTGVQSAVVKGRSGIKMALIWIVVAFYNAYLAGAIAHNVNNNEYIAWCDGLGFLIIITAIVYWSLFYYFVLKKYAGKAIYKNVLYPIELTWDKLWKQLIFRAVFYGIILAGLLVFLIIDTKDNRRRLISAMGIPILLLIALLVSKHPARVVWRHVLWATALQFLFGLLILRWELGKDILQCVSGKVERFLKFTDDGSSFVYGFTATGFQIGDYPPVFGAFAFSILSVIFYFSFVVALLYHIGAMTWVVVKIGWLLQITVGTTAAESMNAAANIFLGMTEAPLVIKPFLNEMTNSELNAVMTGGFATIAGTVMGAFISFGVSASHLLSASFMSAPAALALAKLVHPETKVSRTTSDKIYSLSDNNMSKKSNFLAAASEGASQAVVLVANIVASLIAIIAFVALLDAILAWFGMLVGFDEFSFQWLLTKLFYPFAFIIGIDTEELEDVSYLLGLKTVVNEFVAYEKLTNTDLSPRSKAIATYALCCFANFSSIGIQLGGLGAIAPLRRKDFAKTIWRAFIAGNFAALMTACIAGTLTDEMGYADWMASNRTTVAPLGAPLSLTANFF